MTLGQRLRTLRGDRTQQEIGKKLGISRARYSHYETDHVQPDHELLYKIADVFEVSIDYLLGRDAVIAEVEGLSEEERTLIEGMRKLSDKDREYISELVERLKGLL